MPIVNLGQNHFVASCGHKIHAICLADESSQDVILNLPEIADEKVKKSLQQDIDLVVSSFSDDKSLLAVADNAKRMFIIDSVKWECIHEFKLERNPTEIICHRNFVVVSDRSGDVYYYNLHDKSMKMIMGHLSMILDMKISLCGKFLATCDRDEKIRISQFPNSYNIESFCLGHTEFVSSILFTSSSNLISGSGDGTVKLWSFLDGKLLYDFDCRKHLKSTQAEEQLAIREMICLNNQQISISFYSCNQIMIVSTSHDEIRLVKVLSVDGKTCWKQLCLGNTLILFSDQPSSVTCLDTERGFSYSDIPKIFRSQSKISFIKEFNHEESDLELLYKQLVNNVESYLKKKDERIKNKK